MYLTVEQHYQQNGERHLERAIAYASAGYPDRFYEGSMKKAKRNLAVAACFKLEPWQEKIANELAKHVADNILFGTAYFKQTNFDIEFIGLERIYNDKTS